MSKSNLGILNLFINSDTACVVDGCSFETVEPGFDISPEDFLKFAEHDLLAKYDHHFVNSLSNIKRAIDSQLDSLLIGFGLSERAKKWNFPTKIDYLNSIGVISPRILNKINKRRNLLEHEYKNPNQEEVEDALDVAILFVKYTDKYLFRALKDCYLLGEEGRITITLNWKECKITADYPIYEDNKYSGFVTEVVATADQKEYAEYLKFFLKLYNYL